ncbi:MMPL family transporter [Pseudomonas zhanjiangensis]|uniref:MMPL family transporter n=1 Tax=Pseudomonas zhanjiangensis TaxID=3239015 RepID=A0ABV3YQ16_9PSED
MPIERSLPRLFLILLLALLALTTWQWRQGPPVSASLLDLLPAGSGDARLQQAERRMQEPLNRELLVLIGHPRREQAIALARDAATDWQASGRFERVQWRLDANLAALREQLRGSRLSLLPEADRRLLIEHPDSYITQRAAQLFDPFAGVGLLPTAEDWLGLGVRAQQVLSPSGAVQADLASGALLVQDNGLSWALLRARTGEDAFDLQAPPAIAAAVQQLRERVSAEGGQLLAGSGLLHAAAGQARAAREIGWIGGGALLGTLLLLLLAYRRPRVLLGLLPVGVALLAGSAACVLLFGQINALTLVLGASLIGVTVDFPQHYLSKSWGAGAWRSWDALRATLPGLSLSLTTNLIGYLALAFTPFPALTQVAVFSSAGLIAAYLCAVCLLPAWFAGLRLRPPASLYGFAAGLLQQRARLLGRIGSGWLLGLLLLFCAGGLWQVQAHNELRQWLGQEPRLQADARRIAELTGQQPTSQFFLVSARDEDQLLQRQADLAARLDALLADGQLRGYRALSQLLAPAAAQQALGEALQRLPAHWQPLLQLGVPPEALQDELRRLLDSPRPTLEQALAGPLGEAWRPLWLGRDAQGEPAGLVSLQGQASTAALRAAAEGLEGVRLVDRLGELNAQFSATQLSAAELKLLSCAAILALLCLPFGLAGALRVVCLPLLAALAALACLGWLGQPLTLFSLFGLLLVTAIGVDYSILMRESVGGPAVCLLGVLLSALTSWLSFGLLLVSQTPVIANFGLTLSLGLLFSFLLSPWATKPAPSVANSNEARSPHAVS